MFQIRSIVALAATLLPAVAFAQDAHVETRTNAGDDPRHPTATVTHVDLDPTSGDDVATAIDRVPGVHSRRTSFGQSAFATIRGSNSRQVLVEFEGLRLNPPFGPGFDLGGAAIGVDSVAVWRGAAATYRGSGALAGALELRSRHARRPGIWVDGSVLRGSQDTLAGVVSAEVATRDVSSRVGVAGRMSDGDFTFTDKQGTTTQRVNNDHLRGAAFGSTELRDGSTWFRATVFTDQSERGTPGLSEFQQQFDGARLKDQQTVAIVGTGDRDLAEVGDWSLDASLHGGVQLRGYEYANPRPFLTAEPIAQRTRSKTFATSGHLTGWGPSSIARLAADVHYDDWRAETEASRTSSGLGLGWEQTLSDHWTLVGGLRGELDSDGRAAALPAVGALFAPNDAWRFTANAGRTFRAPNLDELYLDVESIRGNPDLQSEHAWVADLGARLRHDWLEIAATGFGRVVDSEILFLPVSAYLIEAQNIDGTWAAGAEAELAVDRKPLRASLGYTWTHARFVETNAPVPLQPEHQADARVAVFPLRGLEVWSGANLRGRATLDVFGNTADNAHVFWDAGLRLGTTPLTVALTVKNVLNDDRAVDSSQQPLPGRTYWASVRAAWEQKQ